MGGRYGHVGMWSASSLGLPGLRCSVRLGFKKIRMEIQKL